MNRLQTAPQEKIPALYFAQKGEETKPCSTTQILLDSAVTLCREMISYQLA